MSALPRKSVAKCGLIHWLRLEYWRGDDNGVAVIYYFEAVSAMFDHNNKKRTEQIEGVLQMLKGLEQL